MPEDYPRIDPLGEAALLVRFAGTLGDGANRAAIAFRAHVEGEEREEVLETASSLASVLVRCAGETEAVQDWLRGLLGERDWSSVPMPPRRRWNIPCSYGGEDGPQLEETARLAGLGADEAVAALSSAPMRVLALGFAPGMPYLGILPPRWDLPRQTALTPRVPRGALVVAVRQLVLFGTEAPTGWRQVGRTLFDCFEPARAAPIALRAGDEVVFPAVAPDRLRALAEGDAEGHGGARCEDLE